MDIKKRIDELTDDMWDYRDDVEDKDDYDDDDEEY